jgi:hypothetical protein
MKNAVENIIFVGDPRWDRESTYCCGGSIEVCGPVNHFLSNCVYTNPRQLMEEVIY